MDNICNELKKYIMINEIKKLRKKIIFRTRIDLFINILVFLLSLILIISLYTKTMVEIVLVYVVLLAIQKFFSHRNNNKIEIFKTKINKLKKIIGGIL